MTSKTDSAKRKSLSLGRLLVVLVLLALAGCSTVESPKNLPGSQLAPAPYFDEATGIYFPGALGSLYRRPVVSLEEKSPGLGTAISYRDSAARIDVFVYDLQASVIPVGIDSEIIQQSFKDAWADLQAAAEKRIYRDLQINKYGNRFIAECQFLSVSFSYGENNLLKDGLLLVAGVNGKILKIRTAKIRNSDTDVERPLAFLCHAIEQSQRSGYGSITDDEYSSIQRTLTEIDLSDGLSEQEAIAIAQFKLVELGYHNRFDPAKNAILSNDLPNSATVRFRRYPISPTLPVDSFLDIAVNQSGEAELLRAEF